jgi:lipopolysaccharide biosynthesis glycosyltransferase/predicted O-methyltransferase YrrM
MPSAAPRYQWTAEQDWFSHNIPDWSRWISLLQTPAPRLLEIGTWEGRSAVWLLENACRDGGDITCIDHFDLLTTAAGQKRYEKVLHNLRLTSKPYRLMDDFSVPALYTLLDESLSSNADSGFDFVYIDGSHEADDTFLDGELAWRLCNKDAIVIFDDYNWGVQPVNGPHHPKRGIDGFMALHVGEYETLSSPNSYQIVLQKTSDKRIGFLSKRTQRRGDGKMEYEVNLAYAIDSDYAMPASVSITSALELTTGRVSIYVLDCGLSSEDRVRLESLVNAFARATIVFLPLPDSSLAKAFGNVWAKIDLMAVLPVERTLYLDADTLARENLRDLWDTDLGGMPVAAAPDVGLPRGEGGNEYFNAGVILLDLTLVRSSLEELLNRSRVGHTLPFADQDVLNAHFSGHWKVLSLAWNAQGLGTYAEAESEARKRLRLEELKNPSIVHFTGPVSPSVAEVLNPWVNYVAKPWGYAGAPRHPHLAEWWQVLERTPWKGWRELSATLSRWKEDEAQRIEEAVATFRARIAEEQASLSSM